MNQILTLKQLIDANKLLKSLTGTQRINWETMILGIRFLTHRGNLVILQFNVSSDQKVWPAIVVYCIQALSETHYIEYFYPFITFRAI